MSDSCLDCSEETVRLPAGIYVPLRDTGTTDHSGTSAQNLTTIALPEDELMENLYITLTGRNAAGSARVCFQIRAMIVRLDSETPNAYSVDFLVDSITAEQSDLEVNLTENGDTNIIVELTHTVGSAGTWTWNWQIWTLDQLKLS